MFRDICDPFLKTSSSQIYPIQQLYIKLGNNSTQGRQMLL